MKITPFKTFGLLGREMRVEYLLSDIENIQVQEEKSEYIFFSVSWTFSVVESRNYFMLAEQEQSIFCQLNRNSTSGYSLQLNSNSFQQQYQQFQQILSILLRLVSSNSTSRYSLQSSFYILILELHCKPLIGHFRCCSWFTQLSQKRPSLIQYMKEIQQ